MEMARAVRMPVHHRQEIARRTVERDRIRNGAPPTERVASIFFGPELAAQIELRLIRILLLV